MPDERDERSAAQWAAELSLPDHLADAVRALRGWSRATRVSREAFENALDALQKGMWG